MFKSFPFIACLVIVTLTALGCAASFFHLISNDVLLKVAGTLLTLSGIGLGIMAAQSYREHDFNATVLLALAGAIDFFALLMVFDPPKGMPNVEIAKSVELMMAIVMACGTASVLLVYSERLHIRKMYTLR